MELAGVAFTSDEVEEVHLARELCLGLTVDGIPITCFDLLDDLLEGRVNLDGVQEEHLLRNYQQLKEFAQFWTEVPWFDSTRLTEVVQKMKTVIRLCLKARGSSLDSE